MDCSECNSFKCREGNKNNLFQECISNKFNEVLSNCIVEYTCEEINKIHKIASDVESEGYMKWPRLKEIIEFSKKLGFKKIGIAFCIGLKNEVKTISEIMRYNGLEIYAVICKVGSIPKSQLKIKSLKEDSTKESICNPIGQAEILNKIGTDLNIIVGLCVGHDILFTKFSKAPVSTLIVKDRVLGHNPIAALYSSYYKEILRK